MTPEQALRYVRYHGVVLESAHGQDPSLAEKIAGERIRGSWWTHRRSQQIFDITRRLRASRAVLVCLLAGGRITYVHRRLWPHFVRLSARFPPGALDQVIEQHEVSGRHTRDIIMFPEWVPATVLRQSKRLSEPAATREIGAWLDRYGSD